MFVGEFAHSLDAKGRVILPQRLREALGERFMVTRGLERCLFVFPMNTWGEYDAKARNLPITDKRARKFMRVFMSGAYESEADAQGRTVIPPNLRTHAGLVKDLVIIGVSNRVEIWSKENWDEYCADDNLEVDDDLGEYMREIGF